MQLMWFLVFFVSLFLSCSTESNELPDPMAGASGSSETTFGGGGGGGFGSPRNPEQNNTPPGSSTPETPGIDDSEDAGSHWGEPPRAGNPPDATNGTVSQDDPIDGDCGYGIIYGLICSKTEQMFVNNAHVWLEAPDCDGVTVKRETMSDGDGFYTLEDVPSGLQTIHIEKDGWTKEYPVQVVSGKLSDVTGVAHKECFQVVQCEEDVQDMSVESSFLTGLADIVIFIDTSGSMRQEAKWVQENVNAFAQYIGNQLVDYHVVLVAKGYNICVPPPLGGPNCTDGPKFRHIQEKVSSLPKHATETVHKQVTLTTSAC